MTDFGYQLYSSRNNPPLSKTLKMVSAAGYTEVEGYGGLFAELDEQGLKDLRRELDDNGLTMPTAHIGLDTLETETGHALKIAAALGIKTIYCPFLPADQRPRDADGWAEFGKRLEKAAAGVRPGGLGFGWHNHAFEFETLDDGSLPIEHLFGAAQNLEWEADIAWVKRGGADPFEWIDKLVDRITAVHVKDIAPAGENAGEDGWADVGHGTLDWPKLFDRLQQTSARHYVMEHDKPSDDKRFATRSIEAARKF